MSNLTTRACEHGALPRQCQLCDDVLLIEALTLDLDCARAELDNLKRELQTRIREAHALRRRLTDLEDEKNGYIEEVGNVLGQGCNETLLTAALRVVEQRDALKARNAEPGGWGDK